MRARTCWVLLEVDGLFGDLLFRFQISQSTPPSLTLFARQHTANTAVYRAISYLPRGAMPSCNASSDMPCQGRKAAPPQLTQHCPSPRPDQVHAHAWHMLRGFQRGSLCACTRALARGHVQAVAHRLHLDLLELQLDRRRRPVAAQRSEHQRQRRARHQGTATVGVVHHGDPACAVSKSVSKSASKSVSKSASQSINQSVKASRSVEGVARYVTSTLHSALCRPTHILYSPARHARAASRPASVVRASTGVPPGFCSRSSSKSAVLAKMVCLLMCGTSRCRPSC